MMRHAVEERCRHSFSAAMHWLRGSEADGLAIDDHVVRIKANLFNHNLLIVDASLHDAEGPNPTPDVAAWLDAAI